MLTEKGMEKWLQWEAKQEEQMVVHIKLLACLLNI